MHSIFNLFSKDYKTIYGVLVIKYINTNDINNVLIDYNITDFTGNLIVE